MVIVHQKNGQVRKPKKLVEIDSGIGWMCKKILLKLHVFIINGKSQKLLMFQNVRVCAKSVEKSFDKL